MHPELNSALAQARLADLRRQPIPIRTGLWRRLLAAAH